MVHFSFIPLFLSFLSGWGLEAYGGARVGLGGGEQCHFLHGGSQGSWRAGNRKHPENTSQTWRKLRFREMKCVCVCVCVLDDEVPKPRGREEGIEDRTWTIFKKWVVPWRVTWRGAKTSYGWKEKEIRRGKREKQMEELKVGRNGSFTQVGWTDEWLGRWWKNLFVLCSSAFF